MSFLEKIFSQKPYSHKPWTFNVLRKLNGSEKAITTYDRFDANQETERNQKAKNAEIKNP